MSLNASMVAGWDSSTERLHRPSTRTTIVRRSFATAPTRCPPEVERVVVLDRGEENVVPVENGYFLYAAWKQDTPGDDTSDPPRPEVIRTEPG